MRPEFALAALWLAAVLVAPAHAASAPREISIDASAVTGTLRNLQGVAGVPHAVPVDGAREIPDLTPAWRDAGVSFVRTFDWHARLDTVDNPNSLFPRWAADPDDPASYNFAVADSLVKTLRSMGAEVMFTIASEIPHSSKPPADLAKYERVVRRIVQHYTRGWAGGMRDAVRWWEFGDQPDFLKTHYDGTPEQFLDQYAAAARAVKSVDAKLRFGGPNLAFPLNREAPYREGLLKALREREMPLDFISWIWFADNSRDPMEFARVAAEMQRLLEANGFRNTKQVLASFNMTGIANANPDPLQGAGFVSAAMMLLQDAPVERAALFRLDTGWDLHYRFPDPSHAFERNGTPDLRYHAFRMMGRLQSTPQRLKVQGGDDHSFVALAGRDASRQRVRILVSRYAIPPQYLEPTTRETFEFTVPIGQVRVPVSFRLLTRRGAEAADQGEAGYVLNVNNLPWGRRAFTLRRYRVDAGHAGTMVAEERGEGGTARISADLAPPAVELIELEAIR
jgi:xylan 1,4-beta-xylosidase